MTPGDPVAIVTGAGRGIGRATAVALDDAGYRVVLVGRGQAALEETAELVKRPLVAAADVTDPDAVTGLVEHVLATFHRIDAVVNNAGLAPVRSIEQITLAEWRAVLDTNLSAAFYLTKAAWPTFARQRAGVVVNVSSLSSRDPFPGFAAYGAAKAGLNLWTLAMAREGEPLGVRVHAVAPGAVETDMLRSFVPTEQWPAHKTLDPADVARVIAGCVTGELRHTSGEVIYVHKTL